VVYTDSATTATVPTSPLDTVWSGTTTLPSITSGQAIIQASNTLNNRTIYVRGILVTNAAGTILPQVGFSAAPGAVTRSLQGSYWKITPIGGTSSISVGNFA